MEITVNIKALDKLSETVGAAFGTLYKPTAIRKEADAEAYKIKVIAEANAAALIVQDNVKNELLDRARQRLVNQEVNRQINIDSVIHKSIKHLGDEVSEKPVDADWRTKYFNYAQDISNEEMQEIWAKILASEVSMPGQISLRTMDIVSKITKQEAEVFQRAAELVFDDTGILKIEGENSCDKYNLDYNDLLTLRACHLIFDSDDLTITFPFNKNINGASFYFGEKCIAVRHLFGDEIRFPQIAFTPAGTELYRITGVESNYDYLKEFMESKKILEFSFEEISPNDLWKKTIKNK